MPDALETQAQGNPTLQAPAETQWTQMAQPNEAGDIDVQPIGTVAPSAPPVPSAPAQNDESILAQPQTDAQLEEMRGKMLRTQTQRTQQLADAQRAAVEAQQQYEQRLHELNLANHQPTAEQPSSPSFKDLLPPSQYDALDPDAKSLLGAVETLMDGKVNALQGLQGPNAGSSEEVAALNARLATIEQTQTQSRVTSGLSEVRQVYGDQVAIQYQNEIANAVAQLPGANVFQIMAIVDPGLALKHAQQQGAAAVTQQQQQDATLAGVAPSPSAQGQQTPYVEGESMAESWAKTTGNPAPDAYTYG